MKKGIVAGTALLIGAGIGAGLSKKLSGISADEKDGKVRKFFNYYRMLNHWLSLKQEGKSLEEYFVNNNIRTIAIYGMGEMGCRLYEELKNSGIEVKYAIDKNPESTYSEIDVLSTENDFPLVDAIVVTAIFAYVNIEEKLSANVDYQIISLEHVVYEL